MLINNFNIQEENKTKIIAEEISKICDEFDAIILNYLKCISQSSFLQFHYVFVFQNIFCLKNDYLINVLGADHTGYIKRITAAVSALSKNKINLICKVCQLV